jgi:hypothetical protein
MDYIPVIACTPPTSRGERGAAAWDFALNRGRNEENRALVKDAAGRTEETKRSGEDEEEVLALVPIFAA